jgi:hypothetical protein
LIDEGRLVQDGPTPDVLRAYHEGLKMITVDAQTGLRDRLNRATGAVRFTEISVENVAGEKCWDFRVGETIRFRFAYRVFEPAGDLRFYFALRSGAHSETVSTVTEILSSKPLERGAEGAYLLELPDIVLRPGDYSLYFWLGSVLGAAFDTLDAANASFPPLTIWSDETDQHKTDGFFSMSARLSALAPMRGAGPA